MVTILFDQLKAMEEISINKIILDNVFKDQSKSNSRIKAVEQDFLKFKILKAIKRTKITKDKN